VIDNVYIWKFFCKKIQIFAGVVLDNDYFIGDVDMLGERTQTRGEKRFGFI